MLNDSNGCAEASAGCRSTGFCFFCLAILLAPPPLAVARQIDTLAGQRPPSVQSITLSGNRTFSSNDILSWMTLAPSRPFERETLEQDLQTVKDRYHREGFLLMDVDSVSVRLHEENRTVDLSIYIREGKQAVLRSLFILGNHAFTGEELQQAIESVPGKPFRREAIERDVQSILNRYEQSGYPFARVSVQDITMAEGETEYAVDATLSVEEGDAVTISELTVWGNNVTRNDVVIREARLQYNVRFRPDMPVRIQLRLLRLQLFSSVSLPELYVRENGTAGLLVRVTEGDPNRFDGVVGYVPSNSAGEPGYVTGLANVQFRNLFGTGRKFSARWQRENRSTQEIELRYHEPWIASYPLNGEAGFYQRKQDSSYVRRSYDLATELMLNEEFRIGASVAQNDVVPSEGSGGTVIPESRTTTVGGFLYYDTRDDILTPRSGLLYRIEYRTGAKKRTLAQTTVSSSTQHFELDLEHHFPVVERQVFSANAHLREFRSGGIDASDLFRVGGATTVRGYREGQFRGSRVAWTNLEYRFFVAPRSFFSLFTDAAYIATPDGSSNGEGKSEMTKVGYGIGLQMDTFVGSVGVSIALGQGDTFSTAKLHLRLVNEF